MQTLVHRVNANFSAQEVVINSETTLKKIKPNSSKNKQDNAIRMQIYSKRIYTKNSVKMASRSTGIFNTLRNKKKIGKKREAHRSFSDLSIQEPQIIFNGHNFIPLTPSDQPPNLPFIKPQHLIPHIPVVRTISNQVSCFQAP